MIDSLISQPNDDTRCFERILQKLQESPVVTVVPKYKPYYASDLYKRVYCVWCFVPCNSQPITLFKHTVLLNTQVGQYYIFYMQTVKTSATIARYHYQIAWHVGVFRLLHIYLLIFFHFKYSRKTVTKNRLNPFQQYTLAYITVHISLHANMCVYILLHTNMCVYAV